jgi:dihydropteroate synthase
MLRWFTARVLQLEHLAELVAEHGDCLKAPVQSFALGCRTVGDETPALMGVVNLSADSWYRESVCLTTGAAIERGNILDAQGAALVDVGGESSLLDAVRVEAIDQQSILLPVVEGLVGRSVAVSVETYHASVAEACLERGAAVINLTGSGEAPAIYDAVARHEAGVIICFVQGSNVREVRDLQLSADPVPMLLDYFGQQIEQARAAGVEKIFIDPGLGFYYRNLQDSALRVRHQMNVFLNSFRLRQLGWPVCHALPHAFDFFQEEVRSAEPFFAVMAALGRTSLFRTHEVARTRAVLETLGVY